MADPDLYADVEPGWYLRQLARRVREDLDLARVPPAEGDPGLPDSDRELLGKVVEHLAWCAGRLEQAAERAAGDRPRA